MTTLAWVANCCRTSTSRVVNGSAPTGRETDSEPMTLPGAPSGTNTAGPMVPSRTCGCATLRVARQVGQRDRFTGFEDARRDRVGRSDGLTEDAVAPAHPTATWMVISEDAGSGSAIVARSAATIWRARSATTSRIVCVSVSVEERGRDFAGDRRVRARSRRRSSNSAALLIATPAAAARPRTSSSSMSVNTSAGGLVGEVEVPEDRDRRRGSGRRGSCASADGSEGTRRSPGAR